MTDPILEARAVTRTFVRRGWGRGKGGVQAVRGVSLRVKEGETLGIVGESGCGKSTMARILAGLDLPTAGEVMIAGENVQHLARQQRKQLRRTVQYIFQDPLSSLNPRKTVRQILDVPLRHLLGMDAARRRVRIDELMALVNLRPEFINRYPHEFSGGQSQRIGIARALAAEPRIMVLDEPTSALDVSVQAQILQLLADLRQRLNLTYVFISHDLAVVEALSDRVAVMYLGKIVEEGPAQRLYRAPRHPYTRVLLSNVPVAGAISPRRIRAGGELPNPAAPPVGCAFASRCYRAEERCFAQQPELESLPNGQGRVACFFADDSKPQNHDFMDVTARAATTDENQSKHVEKAP